MAWLRRAVSLPVDKVHKLIAALKTGALRQHAWAITLTVLLLFVTFVRFHLREMPLERDEGEYGYVAQLILQGKLPYESVYSMKLPGVSAAYAIAMLVLGESAAAIRTLLWLVNVASIVLVFVLGRRLLDTTAGIVAAIGFGLVSLSPSVLGLAAHASHFVVLFVLIGLYVLLNGIESGKLLTLAISGLMFGIAFMMKQPGLLFGLFGLAYLAFCRINPEVFRSRRIFLRRIISLVSKRPGGGLLCVPLGTFLKETSLFLVGLGAPFAATNLLFLVAGGFSKFWFWTFTYAREYGSIMSFGESIRVLYTMLGQVAIGNTFWGILSAIGLALLSRERRVQKSRVFLIGFALSSVATLWIGKYFRHHYFIFALPAVALLAGVAVSYSWNLLRRVTSIELLLAPFVLILFLAAVLYPPIVHGQVWFAKIPAEASELMYRSSIFVDSVQVADYLRGETTPETKIALLGSEPQIYFYSRRQSATGYIYMYPLMEPHAYAAQMQEELVRELESAQPEYVVFVNEHTSWLRRPTSERKIFNWWNAYSKTNYMLTRLFMPTTVNRKLDLEKFAPYFFGDYSIPKQLFAQSIQPDETVPLAIHVYKRQSSTR